MNSEIRVMPLEGSALERALPDLARLRIEVFRAYPYLYDGDLEYEQKYLEDFAADPDAILVGAFDGDRFVGAATASPLATQHDEFRAPFERAGLEVAAHFYFAESVLERPYRGTGIGNRFFVEREEHAKQRPGIRYATFCAVVRPEDHPARPDGYRPLDAFWRRRGYEPLDGVTTEFEWREVGASEESAHRMQFWRRDLHGVL